MSPEERACDHQVKYHLNNFHPWFHYFKSSSRSNIQRSSRRLRSIISAPEFVEFFGEASPHPEGERQNIFGMDDELKVAPKGFAKDHKYACWYWLNINLTWIWYLGISTYWSVVLLVLRTGKASCIPKQYGSHNLSLVLPIVKSLRSTLRRRRPLLPGSCSLSYTGKFCLLSLIFDTHAVCGV